ncbi:MAG TPA: S41 family peptidase [Terriglobia bacterium]|nr:S41 family peptidase [Terriglobia bacterium]
MFEKICACLLRLYPSAFRARYEEEALQLYRDRLRDETGMFQRCRLYFDLLLDALVALPQAWGNTSAVSNAAPLVATAQNIPSFRLLDKQPLRPVPILIGSTFSFAALSAFGLMMRLPSPSRSYSISSRPSPIKSVTKRLNHAAPAVNDDHAATANGSGAAGAPQRQSPTGNASTIPVDSGVRLDDAERGRVIRAVASILVAHYVDPQKAHEASDLLLTREKRGEYGAIVDGPTLAGRLTKDIRASTKDSRVLVQYNRHAIPNSPPVPSAAQREEYRAAMLRQNCTIGKVQVLPNNIGYIKFNFFPDPIVCSPIFHASVRRLNQSDAIIFDLRDNTGGIPDMVADVAAELFDKPVLWYNPRATPNASMLPSAHGSKLANKPVYILTSTRTFSGAEHFTYDLKMLKRATVIGETTRGGHPGAVYHIDDHFWMVVPEVRKPSPYGTLDWQGTGVEPDVKVRAADALAIAEKLAARKLRMAVRSGSSR